MKESKNIFKYISTIILIIYIGGFYILQPAIGNSMMILSIIPVLLFTWFFNVRYGLIIQFLLILNRFVAYKVLGEDPAALFMWGLIIGTTLNFVLLFLLHYFKTLLNRIKLAENKTRENEQNLKRQNEEYELLNKDYKSQNRELLIAKTKAEESDRLKSAFLANMSHEIRTPLNSVIGFSQLLESMDFSHEIRTDYVKKIQDSGKHLLRLIDDIIELSRIDANELKLQEEEFSLNSLLLETIFSVQDQCKNQELECVNIYLNKGLQDGQDIIYSDNTRLRQIVTNLLSNAVKFTSSGSIGISYSVQENKSLLFQVKDTGIGLSEEEINIIFDRFRQADEGISRKYGGTGLGLAITKACVELLGGKIWIKSVKGNQVTGKSGGSVFYFTILYKPVSSIQTDEQEESEISISNANDQRTILIVEDDEDNTLILEAFLEITKAEILHTKYGSEAVEICKRNNSINIVLMDIQLPDISGYEATKQIKQIRPDLPIIAQTANAMREDKSKAIKAGCDDYISKPIDKNTLFSLISKYI